MASIIKLALGISLNREEISDAHCPPSLKTEDSNPRLTSSTTTITKDTEQVHPGV